MQQLPESSISHWITGGLRDHPAVVDWFCPYCHRLASFSTKSWQQLSGPNWYSSATCPGCHGAIQLFTFEVGTGPASLCGGKLFIFPSIHTRTPSVEVMENEELTPALRNAYKSAVNVLNSGEWNAAAAMCRRLLEGIGKAVLPAEAHDQPLSKQLQQLPSHLDLSKPIVELAHAVRKGGNLGAHFDLERETDSMIANAMLDLCEDLLDYLFTLPHRIEELHARIESLEVRVAPHAQ